MNPMSSEPRSEPAYAELVCQSNFSFLQGASHPEELVRQADFLRYQALAITDECSLAGVVRAYTAIKEQQLTIQLIVGSLFQLDDELTVVLLCPNRLAYAELSRVISNARRRSAKGEYQLAQWDLRSLKHCLILWLPKGNERDQHWGQWLSQCHPERVWLAVQRPLQARDKHYLDHCRQLSRLFQLPITACGAVLMHSPARLTLQHTLTAIRLGVSVAEAGFALASNAERSLRPRQKLAHLFPEAWLQESVAIAQRCQFCLSELRYEYPSELVPSGLTAMAHLRHLVAQGAAERFTDGIPPAIAEIISKELALIEQLHYPYFFLTIHDIVQFAQQQGILYQGRGSAANSVVCYCLKITAVDPRQVSVLFERFISKERNEPPDIDVDFEHERREEVIQYIYQKYGRERAALAATVICYRFKSAVRDVGKALGLSDSQLDYFIKNVNRRDKQQSWPAQLAELGLAPDSRQGRLFIELVNEILGFPRHLSQHVGGFVISAGPLYELVPVENAAMADRTVIQWDKDDLESLGLLKVDILALGMLSALRKCFQLLSEHYQHHWQLADLTRLPDDPQVYQMLQQADSVGVFQVESRAQMSMLPRLKPANYYDLVIQIAIVRPSPIQGDMVHPFLKRRHGLEAAYYPSPAVQAVLERTMGVPIFQEQVIKLAMVAAGFSGGEADQLRRAMASWKKTGQLEQFKPKLLHGMQRRGYSLAFAEQLFQQICGFGEYGFPESHSASFAVLAYASAWLKYYYPAAFYTALLNSQPMGFYSPSQLLQDAKRHGIPVLPICINHSHADHQLVANGDSWAIRLGFRLVKGLSQHGITRIVTERPEGGFSSLAALQLLGLNRRDLAQLASANALIALSGHRFQSRWALMDNELSLPLFQQAAQNTTRSSASATAVVQQVFPWQPDLLQEMTEDYAATGLSLQHHPVALLAERGQLGTFTRSAQLKQCPHQSLVTVIGLVTGKQAPGTAAGVTFFTLEDDTGNINVVVWAGTAHAQKSAYLTAKLLKVKGILEREGDVIHVIAGQLTDLSAQLAHFHHASREFH